MSLSHMLDLVPLTLGYCLSLEPRKYVTVMLLNWWWSTLEPMCVHIYRTESWTKCSMIAMVVR